MGQTSGAGAFSAGEAVGPNAMSAAEFSAIPGAQGGQVGGGNTNVDWASMLQKFAGGQANTATSSTSLSSAGGGAGGSTAAASLIFPAIAQLLQAITAARGKRGGVGGMMSMGGAR